MLKIAIVGPESSGKTTLSQALAARYGVPCVPEFARTYLEHSGGQYAEEDLLHIAAGQRTIEDVVLLREAPWVVCDTDMITIRIWSEEKYGRCDPRIRSLSMERPYHHWLLCRPDIPWQEDPLRENPHDRDRLFAVYEDLLKRLAKPFSIIAGDAEQRMRTATAVIDTLLPPKG